MKEKKKTLKKKNLIKNANKIAVIVMLEIAIITQVGVVFGADDPLSVINNLSTFIFSVIRAIRNDTSWMGNCTNWYGIKKPRSKPTCKSVL